jgi:valyl-tRNA synthetase
LPAITVMDEAARMNAEAGEFGGLDRHEARAAIAERLRAMGDLEGERAHRMVVGHCDRCGTVIEPRLSVQWFIDVKPLAERALASVTEGRTRIIPSRYAKVYAHWMENIHDWAVGRQLWWGHRIPAWFCPDGHISVTDAEAGPDACAECGRPAAELTQETDIFDTWFSSGLWPFSTLGWPDETEDYRRFYPTSVMETGYDIIFFWVARMMMLGLFCTGVEPFHTVYLHGLIRREGGVKMSKTKGNVVDPIEAIEQIGADALRYALVAGTAPGSDQVLTDAKLDGGRNFSNKLWNAARWVLGSRPQAAGEDAQPGEPSPPERWIRSRLAGATARATAQLDALDLAGYVATVHEFAWTDYCDWFVEMAKVDLRPPEATADGRLRTWRTAAEALAGMLRLLHPIMPFVTEHIWALLHELDPTITAGEPLLVRAAWPSAGSRDPRVEELMGGIHELVRGARNLRTEAGVAASAWVPLVIAPADGDAQRAIEDARPYLEALARGRPLTLAAADGAATGSAASTRLGAVSLGATDESGDAASRREAESARLVAGIDRLRTLLANRAFVERAPAAVVDGERARLADLEAQLRTLRRG